MGIDMMQQPYVLSDFRIDFVTGWPKIFDGSHLGYRRKNFSNVLIGDLDTMAFVRHGLFFPTDWLLCVLVSGLYWRTPDSSPVTIGWFLRSFSRNLMFIKHPLLLFSVTHFFDRKHSTSQVSEFIYRTLNQRLISYLHYIRSENS